MSEDYRDGFRAALRALKREVDDNPRWDASNIYKRISELLHGEKQPAETILNLSTTVGPFVELSARVEKLEALQVDLRAEVDELKQNQALLIADSKAQLQALAGSMRALADATGVPE